MDKTIAIIMGAAVLPDGRPSTAMRRRVEAALNLRDEFIDVIYIPSGGKAENRTRSEADVMQDLLLHAGVNSEQIFLEAESKNTLQNVSNSARIIRQFSSSSKVIVCSDTYHILRCRLLLYLLGISTIYRPMPSGKKTSGRIRWIYCYIREAVAIPVHVLLLFILKYYRKV